MTALEITRKNYNKFDDKKEITELTNALLSVESDYAKRDNEGYKIEGKFSAGLFSATYKMMRNEFVTNKRCSFEIRELCIKIMKEMNY